MGKSIRVKTVWVLFCLLAFAPSQAQRQLLLLRGDEVVHRFKVGDNIHSKLIGYKREHWGFLVEINEFLVITSQDTIELHEIRKVLLPGKRPTYSLGRKLVTAGVGLFSIDQFNTTVIQHSKPEWNAGVTVASVIVTSVGLPMLFFKKNWRKISGRAKLISVGRASRFYLSE